FPPQDWFYIWAAGMPAFDNYPGLPYVASLPMVRLIGEVRTLELLALVAMLAFGLGFYGHVRVRTGDRRTAFLATVMVLTSMAIWHYLLAAQPILSSLSFGIGGTILGVDRPELGYSDKIQLVAPQFAGFAAFSIPVLVVLLSLPRRFWKSLGAGLALVAVIAYMFAP